MTETKPPIVVVAERVDRLEGAKVTYRAATVVATNPGLRLIDVDVENAGKLEGIRIPEGSFYPRIGDEGAVQLQGSRVAWVANRLGVGAVGEDELAPEVTGNITAAMDAANGKNKVTFTVGVAPSASTPGTTAGDVWFQRDTFGLGVIVGSWEWTGTEWSPRFFGDSVLNSLTVGKLVGGTGTFDLVVGGRITTASTGQRTELNPLGLQGFNPGNGLTVHLDGVSNLLIGQIRTASTGERMILNPGGNNPSRLDLYPATGTQFATIEAETISGQAAVLLTAGNASTTTKSGVVAVRRSFAHFGFGLRNLTLDSGIYADTSTVRTTSEIIDIQYVVGQGTAGGPRIAMGAKDNNLTQLNVWTTANSQPWIHAVNHDVGIWFGSGVAHIVANNAFTHRSLQVDTLFYSTLTNASSRAIKDSIIEASGLVDVRAATRSAKAKQYRIPARGNEARPAEGELGEMPEVEAPLQIGLIAEQMPAVVQTTAKGIRAGDDDVLGYDLGGVVALTWSGLGDAFADIDGLRAELATLRAALPTAGPRGIK